MPRIRMAALALIEVILGACSSQSTTCSVTEVPGDYLLSSDQTLAILLKEGGDGEFVTSQRPSSLKWTFVPAHNLIELDLETGAADRLNELMGLKRPPDALVTDRSVVGLTPICNAQKHVERLSLSDVKDLEFVRK